MHTAIKRLPRFRRDREAIRRFKLTARDYEIVRQIARHRFLTSPQICSLVEGAATQIVRRLQCLFHAGHLDRPRCQMDYYHAGGSRVMVYGLASRGAGVMRQKFNIPFSRMDWETRNRNVGRIFLEHAVMTAGILIGFELACRASEGSVKLIRLDDIPQSATPRPPKHQPWHHWRTMLGGKLRTLIPDAAFLLEYADEPTGKNQRLCLIEADRGTMPLRRSRGSASCIERKLHLYAQLWKSGQFGKISGAHRIQVWIVTTGPDRVAHMKEAFAGLPMGRGLFRFTEMTELADPAFILGNQERRGLKCDKQIGIC